MLRVFAKGIQPPKWVFPYVISDIDNLFTSARDVQMTGQTLLDDFRNKIAPLAISAERKQALNMAAVKAWSESAAPALSPPARRDGAADGGRAERRWRVALARWARPITARC